MKIKRIKSEKQLKAGPYIRAAINCYGHFWMEYQVLVGKPYNCKNKVMNKERQIKGLAVKSKYYQPNDWFLSSLSEELNPNFKEKVRPFKIVLIPFSNKAWNYLKTFDNVRDFAEATNGFRSTDEQYEKFCYDNDFNKWQSEQSLKIRNERTSSPERK